MGAGLKPCVRVKALPLRLMAAVCSPQVVMETTSTFKQQKFQLVQSGFDPAAISDPLYVLDYQQQSYVPLTENIYRSIMTGERKL